MELFEAFSPLLPALENPTIITHLEELTISNVIFLNNFCKCAFCDMLIIKCISRLNISWGISFKIRDIIHEFLSFNLVKS